MSDKLREGIAVAPSFISGEQTPAAKLTVMSQQMKKGLNQVESAVGDILNDSWPYTSSSTTKLTQAWGKNKTTGTTFASTESRNLDIVNLARLIGPAGNLNPKQLPGTHSIVDTVSVGVHEFSLSMPPDTASTVSFSDATVFATYRSTVGGLTSAGDYHVSSDGKVFTVSATNGGTATYNHTSESFNGGYGYAGSTFNVLPDPNQLAAGGNGLTIGSLDSQNRYPLTLPTITHQQSNVAKTSAALAAVDPNYSAQLYLPKVLTDNLTTGDEIPAGFLYVRNFTTNEVYTKGIYYYNSSTSILMGNVDLTAAISAGNKLQIITVGTDITTAIDDLRDKSHHTHDRSNGEPFIDVGSISGVYTEAGISGIYLPSSMPGNHFSQYLHRDGYSALDANYNDENIMRGDLVLGAAGGAAGTYYSDTGATFGLYFGTLNGPQIYKHTSGRMIITNPLATNGAIDVISDSNFVRLEGIDVYINGGLQVTGTHSASTFSSIGITSEEGIEAIDKPLVVGSVIAGTLANYDKWERSVDATGVDGTNNVWVHPKIQFLLIKKVTVPFIAYDNTDTAITYSSATPDPSVSYWMYELDPPVGSVYDVLDAKLQMYDPVDNYYYLDGSNNRLGELVSTNRVNGETLGPEFNVRIDLSGGKIQIIIPAQFGDKSTTNVFNWDNPLANEGGFASLAMTFKLFLTVAAEGSEL